VLKPPARHERTVFPDCGRAALPAAIRDNFDRLTFLGWRLGAGRDRRRPRFGRSCLFGYTVIYWRKCRHGFHGDPQRARPSTTARPAGIFFDHTACITILSTKLWFQFLHAPWLARCMVAVRASAGNPTPAAFDAAMTHAIRAGRVLVWLIAAGCVLIFAALMRARGSRTGASRLLATVAFAFSGGGRRAFRASCAVNSLPPARLFFALLILIVVGRRATLTRPLAGRVGRGIVHVRPREQGAIHPVDRRRYACHVCRSGAEKKVRASRSGARHRHGLQPFVAAPPSRPPPRFGPHGR